MGQPWFDKDVERSDLYPVAIKHLLNVASDRRKFFERIINPEVDPSAGYRALANILQQGWITTVLTTNFDECLPRAQRMIARPHNLALIKTSSDLIRFTSAPQDPQLIYLHGSVEHYTDKNLADDVRQLDPAVVERIKPLLRDHPVIVVGYRGTEPSVMNDLFEAEGDATHTFVHGIYWCVRERTADSRLSPLVERLAARIGGNFNRVSIEGFDQLIEGDLWNPMISAGAQPARKLPLQVSTERPFDMQIVPGATADDLDKILLFTRLKQYAATIQLRAPDHFDEGWTLDTATSFNLLEKRGTASTPTFAGWLLFGKNIGSKVTNAFVSFAGEGPEEWLRSTFGQDVELLETEDSATWRFETEIHGSLWNQIDSLIDLLSLANQDFRLKEETSRQVRAFSPLALKEMLVNAIAHRDYANSAPVKITVLPNKVVAESPGGLIDEVLAEIGDSELETLIKNGRRHIKGYRNPVIADLLYGGGAMDHTGSGLSDMWLQTVNNNGSVDFGPNEHNDLFVVTIQARPEAIDRLTNTAVPASAGLTHRFATNLVPFVTLPQFVWHAGTKESAAWVLARQAADADLLLPKGYIHDGRYWTFFDLEAIVEQYVTPFDIGDVESLSINELLALPHGSATFIKLLTDAFNEHLKSIGMYIDHRHERAHFFREETTADRRITYQGRVKRATRTVVKSRTRRDSADIAWYEHKALSFSIVDFANQWATLLTPGYAFTQNGYGRLIGREKINSLSTRRAAKDFNSNVHNDLTFWLAMISDDGEGVFALDPNCGSELEPFAPTITLSSRLPTVSFNAAAFGVDDESPEEVDDDLRALDQELEELADEEDAKSDPQKRSSANESEDSGNGD